MLLTAEKGKGLVTRGKLRRQAGKTVYQLHLTNGSSGALDGFMVQVNSNSAGLAPVDQVVAVGTLSPGGSGSAQVVMAHNAAKQAVGPFSPKLQVRWGGTQRMQQQAPMAACVRFLTVFCCPACTRLEDPCWGFCGCALMLLQVALRTNQLGVLYWDDSIPLAALLAEDGTIDGQTFLNTWRTLPEEVKHKLPLTISDIEVAKAKLQAVNLFVLAHRPVRVLGCWGGGPAWAVCKQPPMLTDLLCVACLPPTQVPGTGQDALYITGRAADVAQVLLELRCMRGTPGIDVSYKSERQDLADAAVEVLASALK